jgi:hypothetical protein
MSIKKLGMAAALTVASMGVAHAQSAPSVGQFVPELLTQLGTLSEPILPPIQNLTGPFVAAAIPVLIPLGGTVLGSLLSTPINLAEAALGGGGDFALPGLE